MVFKFIKLILLGLFDIKYIISYFMFADEIKFIKYKYIVLKLNFLLKK